MVELIFTAAAGCQEHTVQDTFHTARDPPVVDGRGQDNAVCFDTLVNDLIDHIILLDAVDIPIVQAVITGHAGMDARTGLQDFKLDPFLCEFRRHDIKTL